MEQTLDYTGNFSGSHDGVDYDVSYECSHDIDFSYEAEIRDYVEEKISNGYDSGYESFEMSTGFYEGEIEIEGTVTWESSETFDAPTGYTERGPRPFYGNPRKMAVDRWGNRRFIRRRKDGTYMKNVDVGRSLAMDRRRQSQTWAPAGFRDQGDGSPSLLVRLLDMFKGVDEEVLMAESYLMSAETDDYYPSVANAEYSQDGEIDLSAYISYEWSIDTPDQVLELPEATISHIDSVIEDTIIYNYENYGSQAEEDVSMDVDLAYYDDSISVEVTYSWHVHQKVGYRSESDAYIYAYNDGHSDGRSNTVNYRPSTTDRELTAFKKIFKQAEEDNWEVPLVEKDLFSQVYLSTPPTPEQNELLDAFLKYDYYDPDHHDDIIMRGLSIVEDDNFLKLYDACLSHDGIIDGSHPAEAYIIAIDCYRALYDQNE